MRKKENLPQNDGERQKIHVTRQGWVDIFTCKTKVGDGEKLNHGKEDYCCVLLRVVKARMTPEHSDWFKQRDRYNTESITGFVIHSRLRTRVARKLLY